MKYFYTVFTILVIHSSWHFTASAQNVNFPDPNLAAAVRGALGLGATDPIPQTDLNTLANLYAGNAGITDLTGLESATGLTSLTLSGNQITDISPLADLTLLWNLVLNGNQISDISPLARLTVLFDLNLNENPISDFEPLAGLTALTNLNLLGTGFSNSDFAHISPLVNLTALDLSDNEISSLVGFGTFPRLTGMLLADNRIRGLTPLTNLQNPSMMESLSLPNNQITDIMPLSRFTGLTQLHLNNNQIRDLSPLAGLINLKWRLNLSNNQITDISPLAGLTNLIRLYLDRNQITDISPLENLTNLTTLYIHRNQITDLTPLTGLTNLRTLVICYNLYTDISPLANLTSLTTLYIDQVFVEANAELVAATTTATLRLCAPLPDPPPPVEDEVAEAVIEVEVPIVKNVKKRKPVSIYRSRVAQNPVIFNEILNAADDKNDWIELKNIADEDATLTDWELSIVNSEGENANKDVSLLTFGDYTLPAGGILLIVNTDPNETDLIRGQNIIDPESNPDAPPQYIIVPEMKLPDTPYMLILRNATNRKENGELKPLFEVPEAFEDLAGNYFRSFADYGTQVWPLINTWRPAPYHTALLTPGQAWQRVSVDERGYTKEAWALSGYQSGLGYKPLAPVETSLGTPGYASPSDVNVVSTGQISFSEVMYSTNSTVSSPSQWIELYNNSLTEVVNLRDWKLVIEARDSRFKHRYTVLVLNTLEVLPNQTVLLVTRAQRNSGNLPERRVYDLYAHHRDAEKRLGLRDNKVLGLEGFALKLLTPDDILVDIAGNMNGENGLDTPAWKLPSGWTEDGTRTSLIRRYEGNVALDGTASTSWVRTVDTALMVAHVYWGSPTDNGTPGYKQGGILPVTLSHFRADRMESGVVLKWRTESEVENAGFNILRSQTRQGRYVKVNPSLIMGAGTISERHDYTWTDTTAKPNVSYYYRIEDVSFAGDRQQLATVRMRGLVSASGKLTTRWSDLKLQE